MFDEKVFNFDISNIKHDLELEGMQINDNDINMFKMYAEEKVDMPELIEMIKNEPIGY